MPATTPAQQHFMALCRHDPAHALGKCPSPQVAEEFSHKPVGGYAPPPAPKKRSPR